MQQTQDVNDEVEVTSATLPIWGAHLGSQQEADWVTRGSLGNWSTLAWSSICSGPETTTLCCSNQGLGEVPSVSSSGAAASLESREPIATLPFIIPVSDHLSRKALDAGNAVLIS